MSRRQVKIASCLSVLLLGGLLSSCRRHSGAEGVVTATPISIGSDWVSIPFAEPMIAKWDAQVIFVEVNTSFQVSYDPLGIRLDDGSIAVPEAEIVTKSGQVQSLPLVGLIPGEQLQFGSDQIARGNSFSELHIRSSKALNCSRISWMSYMPQDLERLLK